MTPWQLVLLGLTLVVPQEPAQVENESTEQTDQGEGGAADEQQIAELDASLPWRTGEIRLGDGVAKLVLPAEYRFLETQPARYVLEKVWGNPPDDEGIWGMIFPADRGPFHEDGWGVLLRFVDEGHVDDADAAKIDYDELLADMRSGLKDANEERAKSNFATLEIVGWAERPHYDKDAKQLFWAKELSFSDSPVHTLNYDVRVLGREGVLSMNAVASVDALPEVKRGMDALLGAVAFEKGHRYEEYDSKVDRLAVYGIGGLIAGKIALKVGLFKGLIALLVAGKKLVLIAFAAVAAFFAKVFRAKKARPAE